MRAEHPLFDPAQQGQRAGSIARFSGEEKAQLVAQAIENARPDFRRQRVHDLAEARVYPPAMFDRAARLLR